MIATDILQINSKIKTCTRTKTIKNENAQAHQVFYMCNVQKIVFQKF